MKDKYCKRVDGKYKPLTDKDRWKIARPFLVKIMLMITEYIFTKDEEYREGIRQNER